MAIVRVRRGIDDWLHRAAQLWKKLELHPGRLSITAWLALTNIIIVAIIVGGVSWAAIDRLRDLANAQGLARAQVAGATVREDLRRYGEDALTSARILAERPTLQRLLAEGSTRESVEPILRRFCETSGLDACAVLNGLSVGSQAGQALPWPELLAASAEQGERFLALPSTLKAPVVGAVAAAGVLGESKVVVARVMGDKLAKTLSERVGLDVRFIDYRDFTAAPVGPFTALHSAGLADGRSAAQRIKSLDLYAASFPIFAVTGEAIALIEVRLPAHEIDAAVDQLVKRLLITAIVLAILAVLAGLILGRRVAGPVEALTDAAVKLGQGDFSAAIPMAGTAEVSQLARTMEDMRRNLVELTGTLRRREAQAQAMLGGISHEFRTPLAAQLASIELLRAGLGSMTEQQVADLVLSIERGVLRLTRLIDNLLENVRIESGQLAIRRQRVALAHAVEDAQTLVGALLAQRRQTLEISLPEDLPLIDGDRQRLAQVFVNLLANANKFAPEGSVVRIGAVHEGDAVTAWVEDEGPGLPANSRARIFERFNRGGGEEPAAAGLGLGLWIVKSIIDRHGGTVTFARTAEHRTRFSFTLPIDTEGEARFQPEAGHA